MFSPGPAFEALKRSSDGRRMYALRRPFFLAAFLGCCVTLMAAWRLDLRMVAGETVSWGVLPLLQILSLFAACVFRRRTLGFSQIIDLFFTGFGPWMLWLIGFIAAVSATSSVQAARWGTPPDVVIVLVTLLPVFLWSLYIDFRFFRVVMERTRLQAACDVALQRAIGWIIWILGCYGYILSPMLAWRLAH